MYYLSADLYLSAHNDKRPLNRFYLNGPVHLQIYEYVIMHMGLVLTHDSPHL